MPGDDPLRMFLVLRRGAVARLDEAAQLAGAAAVACVERFARDPRHADAFAAWHDRPGKVCLRARSAAQWREVLSLPHALAGDPEGASAVALPPRRRSERGPLLERLQAMSTELEPPPADPAPEGVTYVLNPAARMSSGKTLAQVAHAAVMAAERPELRDWLGAGCPAGLAAPDARRYAALERSDACVARVVDAGLTEVPPGTITVIALRR